MSTLKNAIASSIATIGIAVAIDMPTAWGSFAAVSAFTTTYFLPNIIDKLRKAKDFTIKTFNDNKPRAKALAKEAAKKANEVAWACSPTNPEQNVVIGSSIGFTGSNVVAALLELEGNSYPLLVASATLATAVGSHYLPSSKIEELSNKYFPPSPKGKLAPVPVTETVDSETPKGKVNSAHKNK